MNHVVSSMKLYDFHVAENSPITYGRQSIHIFLKVWSKVIVNFHHYFGDGPEISDELCTIYLHFIYALGSSCVTGLD